MVLGAAKLAFIDVAAKRCVKKWEELHNHKHPARTRCDKHHSFTPASRIGKPSWTVIQSLFFNLQIILDKTYPYMQKKRSDN